MSSVKRCYTANLFSLDGKSFLCHISDGEVLILEESNETFPNCSKVLTASGLIGLMYQDSLIEMAKKVMFDTE